TPGFSAGRTGRADLARDHRAGPGAWLHDAVPDAGRDIPRDGAAGGNPPEPRSDRGVARDDGADSVRDDEADRIDAGLPRVHEHAAAAHLDAVGRSLPGGGRARMVPMDDAAQSTDL